MITAFNTTLIGMGRLPTCAVCDGAVELTLCEAEKGKRLRRSSHPVLRTHDDIIVVYAGGDAFSVTCSTCCGTQWCGEQQTPIDARYGLFISDGNVYARIQRGRHDQQLSVSANIVLDSGKRVKAGRKVAVYMRPYVSDCLQRGRDFGRKPQITKVEL